MNNISERLLLAHPDMVIYYQLRYQLYKLLNLNFNLFFTEDIIKCKKLYSVKLTYQMSAKKMDIIDIHVNHILINPNITCRTIDISNAAIYFTAFNDYELNLYVDDITKVTWLLYPYDLRLLYTIFSNIPFNQEQLNIVNSMCNIRNNHCKNTNELLHITNIIDIVNKQLTI